MKFSKELKAGLIAILAIVGFIALYQFMKGKNLFSSNNTYHVTYDNVQGLSVSNPVSINGLHVGLVEKITPAKKKNGKIYFIVTISVDNGFQITKESSVEVFEPGLMSGKELKINLKYGGHLAQGGDTLSGSVQKSMINNLTDQIEPLKNQSVNILAKLDSTLTNSNKVIDTENREQIKLLLKNLNATIASFRETSNKTNSLISKNENTIHEILTNTNSATKSAKETLDKYGKLADNIDISKLNQTIEKLGDTSTELNHLIASIQKGEGSLGKLAKNETLYQNITNTTKSLNDLLSDLKENPKKYINISVFGKK